MAIYLAKRLIGACIVLWAVITITFGLMHAIPGGPFTQEKKLPPAVMATVEARYHLDEPLWDQYVDYVRHAAVLDLGPSYKYPGKTVNDIIAETLPVSAELADQPSSGYRAGILAGMAAAWYKNTWSITDDDRGYPRCFGAQFYFSGCPHTTLCLYWPVLPAALWKGPAYVILPALALAAQPTAFIMRLTRSSLVDALGQDYIRTARSRGIGPWSLLYRHALRNALLPVVSYIGPLAAALMTGSFIVETIFAIPGLGRHFVTSIYNRDYTVILGITIFYSFLIMMMNLLVDIIYPLLDPRITVDSRKEE